MNKHFLTTRLRLRGFTLVEIMVTVGILVVLAGMMILAISSLNDKSKRTGTQSRMKLLSEAITAFKSATGSFPLAVPEDAWETTSGSARDWDVLSTGFAATLRWDGQAGHPNWRNYFRENSTSNHYPSFLWESNSTPTSDPKPTNIQMLGFQLEQVPESNKIFSQIKEKNAVTVQKTFTNPGSGVGIETWSNASGLCQLAHPLDAAGATPRNVYQMQDMWGTPLRFWTSDILTWAKDNTPPHSAWNSTIQSLLSSRLQQANWGFIIESAGKDGKFGWWGQSGIDLTTAPYSQQVVDNIYSVGE